MKIRRDRWYFRGAEVGRIVAQSRSLDGTAVRFHVPHPEHVESTLWKVLGDEAVNEPHLISQLRD
jgi:hypothetical protein